MSKYQDEDVEFDFDEDGEELWEDMPDLPMSEISFTRGESGPLESKLGGCPYLRTKEDYPIGDNGKPMLFLAQINLADVHGFPELPDHGLLQFYVAQDRAFGLYHRPLVRWIENAAESDGLLAEHPYADETYLAALPYERPGKIRFSQTELPDPETGEEDAVPENSRIGGYPYFAQDGEMEPGDFLLLQLADEGECGIGFGDCGVCRFIISREELATRDFSNVLYNWDCC